MSNSARYFFDTNTLVSAILFEHAIPGQAFRCALKQRDSRIVRKLFDKKIYRDFVANTAASGSVLVIHEEPLASSNTLFFKDVYPMRERRSKCDDEKSSSARKGPLNLLLLQELGTSRFHIHQ